MDSLSKGHATIAASVGGRTKRGSRRTSSLFAVLLALLWPSIVPAVEPQNLEYQIKAAFLLNFTRFIEWPAPNPADAAAPFGICILGDDPFGPALNQIVEGETVGSRPIVIRRIHAEAPGSCAILYVSKDEKNIAGIIAAAGPGVLTVGEGDPFLDQGGMIAFVVENRRVRFNIDQTAARKAGLKLSSRLLSVARSIR